MPTGINLGSIYSTVQLDLSSFNNQVNDVRRTLTDLSKGLRVDVHTPDLRGQMLPVAQQIQDTIGKFTQLGTRGGQAFSQLQTGASSFWNVSGALANASMMTARQAVLTGQASWSQFALVGRGAWTSILQGVQTAIPGMMTSMRNLMTASRGVFDSLISWKTLIIGGSMVMLGSSVVQTTMKVQGLKLALNAAAGGAVQGAAEWEWLRQITNGLGLELLSTAESYKGVLAASIAAGKSSEFARAVFQGVAIGARAMGLSTEQSSRVLAAISQVMSKGKLQAEELTQQLGESLPVATSMMAAGLGITTEHMMDLMQKGEITRDALLPFAEQLAEKYGSVLPEATASAAAEFARLQNAGTEAMVALGEGGLLSAVVNVAKALTDLAKNPDIINFLVGLGGWIEWTIQKFSGLFSLLSVGWKRGAMTQEQLLTAMKTQAMAAEEDFMMLDRMAASTTPAIPTMPKVVGAMRGTPIRKDAEKEATAAAKEAKKTAAELLQVEQEKLQASLALEKQKNAVLEAQHNLEVAMLGTKDDAILKAETELRQGVAKAEAASRLNALELEKNQAMLASGILKDKSDKAELEGKIALLELKQQELLVEENIARVKGLQGIEQAKLEASQRGLNIAQDLVASAYQTQYELLQKQGEAEIAQMERLGASDEAVQRKRYENELALLSIKENSLRAEIALMEAEIARVEEAGGRIDDLQARVRQTRGQLSEVLAEKPIIQEKLAALPTEFGKYAMNAVNQILQGFEQGGRSLAQMFAQVFSNLGTGLINDQMKRVLAGGSLDWLNVGIGTAMAGVGALLNRQKAEVESLGEEAKSGIEEVERTRGLIAGEQQIAIASLSQRLGEAFRPTNEILLRMEILLRVMTYGKSGMEGGRRSLQQEIGSELLAGARI